MSLEESLPNVPKKDPYVVVIYKPFIQIVINLRGPQSVQ